MKELKTKLINFFPTYYEELERLEYKLNYKLIEQLRPELYWTLRNKLTVNLETIWRK